MDESSDHCGSGGGVECVGSAKITNLVMTGAGEDEICFEKDSVGSNMKPRFFGRQAEHYGFGGREEERGVD